MVEFCFERRGVRGKKNTDLPSRKEETNDEDATRVTREARRESKRYPCTGSFSSRVGRRGVVVGREGSSRRVLFVFSASRKIQKIPESWGLIWSCVRVGKEVWEGASREKLTWTLVALRAATEPAKEEAMQAILKEWMCCERKWVCVLENDDRREPSSRFVIFIFCQKAESGWREIFSEAPEVQDDEL